MSTKARAKTKTKARDRTFAISMFGIENATQLACRLLDSHEGFEVSCVEESQEEDFEFVVPQRLQGYCGRLKEWIEGTGEDPGLL